jgi:transposase
MTLKNSVRQKIVFLKIQRKFSYRRISKHLRMHDNINITHTTARYWNKALKDKGERYISHNQRKNKGGLIKATPEHLELLEKKIRENPERSSFELQHILIQEANLVISASYIRTLRRRLGWICKRTKYGQMIRDTNKEKRVLWATKQLEAGENFDDVIFSDEASFEVQRSATRTFYKKGERPRLQPKPKHPIKVSQIFAYCNINFCLPITVGGPSIVRHPIVQQPTAWSHNPMVRHRKSDKILILRLYTCSSLVRHFTSPTFIGPPPQSSDKILLRTYNFIVFKRGLIGFQMGRF